jgi:hypothetical protein
MLDKMIKSISKNKQGYFSRDPYLKYNTFINSGSFVIKINDYTRKMYDYFVQQTIASPVNKWPYDQKYISDYVYENKKDFIIFRPDICNTPIGKILRHGWIKHCINPEFQIVHNTFELDEVIDCSKYPRTFIGKHVGDWVKGLK